MRHIFFTGDIPIGTETSPRDTCVLRDVPLLCVCNLLILLLAARERSYNADMFGDKITINLCDVIHHRESLSVLTNAWYIQYVCAEFRYSYCERRAILRHVVLGTHKFSDYENGEGMVV